jgi:hypothetical protein
VFTLPLVFASFSRKTKLNGAFGFTESGLAKILIVLQLPPPLAAEFNAIDLILSSSAQDFYLQLELIQTNNSRFGQL